MNNTRTEHDSFGPIEVPADALWGAQTARSLHFFAIGEQRMPLALVHALAWVKWAAAGVNRDLGLLEPARADAIAAAAARVAHGEFDAQFPISVWQIGSGTQSNMNANEVIAPSSSMPGWTRSAPVDERGGLPRSTTWQSRTLNAPPPA